MDYTDNNPSGTDSLNMTADEAVDMLSNMNFADTPQFDDETEASDVEAGASDEIEVEVDDEHPETDSEETDTAAEADEADGETDEGPELGFDDEAEVSIGNEKVKFKELKAGYLRQSDYTKKTQALSEEKALFTRQRDEVASVVRNNMMTELQSYHAILSHFALPAPDPSLADTAPGEHYRQKLAYEQQTMAIDAFRKRHAQFQAEQTQAQEAQHKQLQASEREKLFDLIPAIDVRGKGEKETAAATAFWRYGVEEYGEEVMNNMADAKMMQTLYKAHLYDESQKRAAKVAPKLASARPMAKPGRNAPTTAEGEQRKALEKVKRSQSEEDAADYIARYKL